MFILISAVISRKVDKKLAAMHREALNLEMKPHQNLAMEVFSPKVTHRFKTKGHRAILSTKYRRSKIN